MTPASDTLSPRCGLCLPTAEEWPTVAMPPAAVGRHVACDEACGRVAYWLVAVPTYRPLGAPVNRQVARLLHLRVPDCGCGAAGDCGTVEHCDLARAWEATFERERVQRVRRQDLREFMGGGA